MSKRFYWSENLRMSNIYIEKYFMLLKDFHNFEGFSSTADSNAAFNNVKLKNKLCANFMYFLRFFKFIYP